MWSNGHFLRLLLAASYAASSCAAVLSCTTDTFTSITLRGGKILSVNTTLANVNVTSTWSNAFPLTKSSTNTTTACQVIFQYTHPGWNDTINTYVSMPVSGWNGRFVGLGGGGWVTGSPTQLPFAVSNGYAAGTTDGGHSIGDPSLPMDMSWTMTSEGRINWPALQDFSSVALDDAATLGKAAVSAFYGSAPKFSYWNGCSTGGRQGAMMAQRYPKQYNGILAGAPAFNWDKFIVSEYWPQLVMNLLDYHPSPCELNAITSAALEACDLLDGIRDNIISAYNSCDFNPYSLVGKSVQCTNPNGTIQITEKGVQVAAATWSGPRTEDGKFQWYGLGPSASLTGLAQTTCTSLSNCTSMPFTIATDWLRIFLLKNTTADLSGLTQAEYSRLFRASVNQYASAIGTGDADLTDFKLSGGRMITWHGTADNLIPFRGTLDYYGRVLQLDPNAADYYRVFMAPSIGHCGGGSGWFPGSSFDALVNWVEKGVAPDALYAETVASVSSNKTRSVNLCPYPKVLTYVGGNPDVAASFICK